MARVSRRKANSKNTNRNSVKRNNNRNNNRNRNMGKKSKRRNNLKKGSKNNRSRRRRSRRQSQRGGGNICCVGLSDIVDEETGYTEVTKDAPMVNVGDTMFEGADLSCSQYNCRDHNPNDREEKENHGCFTLSSDSGMCDKVDLGEIYMNDNNDFFKKQYISEEGKWGFVQYNQEYDHV